MDLLDGSRAEDMAINGNRNRRFSTIRRPPSMLRGRKHPVKTNQQPNSRPQVTRELHTSKRFDAITHISDVGARCMNTRRRASPTTTGIYLDIKHKIDLD